MFMSVTTSTRKQARFSARKFAYAQADIQSPVSPDETGYAGRMGNARDNERAATPRAAGHLLTATPSIVVALLVLFAWYIVTTPGHLSALFLPAPADVFSSLLAGLKSGG